MPLKVSSLLLGLRLHHFQIDGDGDVVADERALHRSLRSPGG